MPNVQWFQSRNSGYEAPKRPEKTAGETDARLFARADADVNEGERRIARQIVLIGELRDRGEVTLEVEKSLERLEAATAESRTQRAAIRERIAAAE